ncbi:MAG: hypothetical protein AAGA99_06695 [Actinomycetota bacterium]
MTFESDLRDRLQTDAATLVPVGAGADRARTRARQRRQLLVGAGLATVLLGGAVAVPRLLDRDTGQTIAVAGDGGATADPVTPAPGEVEFSWQEQDAYVSNLWGDQVLTTADGVTYALSTAPGTRWEEFGPNGEPVPQGLYRSSDGGLTWEAALPPEDLRLSSSLTERDGVLYSITTSPGVDDGTGVEVVRTADGGSTWDRFALPVEVDAPTDAIALMTSTQVEIEWSGDAAVALVSVAWWVDESTLWPTYGEGVGTRLTDEGIDIVDWEAFEPPPTTALPVDEAGDAEIATQFAEDVQPTVLDTIPWAELDAAGPEDFTSTLVFRSVDGEEWEQVDDTTIAGTAQSLTAAPAGFLVSSWGEGATGPTYLASVDGETWEELPTPPSQLDQVEVLGDQLVAISYVWTDPLQRFEVYTSADLGRSWTLEWEREIPSSAGFQAVTGPLGVAIVETAYEEVTGRPLGGTVLHFSPDGTSWSTSALPIPEDQPVWPGFVTANSVVLNAIDIEAEDGSTRTWIGTPTRQG